MCDCVSVCWIIMKCVVNYFGLVTPYGNMDLVNISSGNDLLPYDTKLLPEPMLIYHQ